MAILRKMDDDAAKVLAVNLNRLIEAEAAGFADTALAKRAGVSGNTIAYMRAPHRRPAGGASNLTHIHAVARSFERKAWQLLLDERDVDGKMYTMLMGMKFPKRPRLVHSGEQVDFALPQSGQQRKSSRKNAK